MKSIPIVDLSPITTTGGHQSCDQDWARITQEMGTAMEEIGFVNLVNHGIPMQKIERAFEESKQFFELGSEVKDKFAKDMSKGLKCYHGYSSPSKLVLDPKAVSVTELRESFDLNPCEPSPSFPDEDQPNLGPALMDLENEFRPLIKTLLEILGKTLGLSNESYFNNCTKSVHEPLSVPSFNSFRCNYYPVIPENVVLSTRTVRCSEHSDWGLFTLLLQDSVGGLEVKSNDTWVEAVPIEGAILMNTGDMLQLLSGERFPATRHRILIPEKEILKRAARQSILYFLFPDDDTLLVPLVPQTANDPLLLKEGPPMTALEHTRLRSQSLYY